MSASVRRSDSWLMSRLGVCVIVSAVLLPAAAFAQRAKSDAAIAEEASAALAERRFGDALEAFQKLSDRHPREAPLWFGRGAAAFMLGQNDEAETSFKRALALD